MAQSRNESYNWTVIVADDGSTDGTIENFINLNLPNTKVVLLQNSGGGIAVQTNSIFNYVMSLKNKPQIIFSSDDDIFFKKRGWDSLYLEAVRNTGYDHLVPFNRIGNHIQERLTKNGIELTSLTDAISCMGCFYH